MFCNFCEKFENSKWPPSLARENFFQKWDKYSEEIPCGSKISSKSKSQQKIGQGLLLTGDPHIMVVPPKYFFHGINVQQLIYVLYNFDEIALSHMVKEIQAILCFVIFGKNLKIQNGCHFWGGENFLKIANNTFLRYPVGRKFRRNRSISHS